MIQLSEQEKEALELGMEYQKWAKSKPCLKIMEELDRLVLEALREHEDTLENITAFPEICLKAGIRYVERRNFRDAVKKHVSDVIGNAIELAKQIEQENA